MDGQPRSESGLSRPAAHSGFTDQAIWHRVVSDKFARQGSRSPASIDQVVRGVLQATQHAVDLLAMLRVSKRCRGYKANCQTVSQPWHDLEHPVTVWNGCHAGAETCCSAVHRQKAHEAAPVQVKCIGTHGQAADACPLVSWRQLCLETETQVV